MIPCHDVEFFQQFHYTVTKKTNITGEWPKSNWFYCWIWFSDHLLTLWFPAMMLNSSNNFTTLSQRKQISQESDQNPIGFTAEFDWLIKGCNHTMRFNQPWITMNTQFKIIPFYITIKNRCKDILIHMVLTLITAWRQRRTFSRTFNDIDLKNALVRKNYSLCNWV